MREVLCNNGTILLGSENGPWVFECDSNKNRRNSKHGEFIRSEAPPIHQYDVECINKALSLYLL